MIKATNYANGLVDTFTSDEDTDLDNKPINNPATGVNEKFGKIPMGATFINISSSGLKVFRFKETTNEWQEI